MIVHRRVYWNKIPRSSPLLNLVTPRCMPYFRYFKPRCLHAPINRICRECRLLTNDPKKTFPYVSQLAQQTIPKSGVGLIPVSEEIHHCMLPTHATSYAYERNRISPKRFLVGTLIRSKEIREPVPLQYKNTTLQPRSASAILNNTDVR